MQKQVSFVNVAWCFNALWSVSLSFLRFAQLPVVSSTVHLRQLA